MSDRPDKKWERWIGWVLAPLYVLATTAVGSAIGFAIASTIWELVANPNPAPENFANDLVALMAGAPVGGIVGVIVAARSLEHPNNNS
jgi:hypothetical protein